MRQFFCRRKVKDRKSRSQPSSLIEPLESRTLLSADVVVDLHIGTASTLIAGVQPQDLIYDSTRDQLIVVMPGMVRRYDGVSGQLVRTLSIGGPLDNADITPDGSYLYLSRRSGQLVWKMDLSSNQVFGVVVSDPNLMVAADVAMGTAGVGAIVSFEPQPGNTNTIRQIGIPNGPVDDLVGANGPVTFNAFAVLARSADFSYIAMVSPDADYSYSGGVIGGVSGQGFGTITGLAVSRDGALHAIATGTTLLVEDASFGLVHQLAIAGAGVAFQSGGGCDVCGRSGDGQAEGV